MIATRLAAAMCLCIMLASCGVQPGDDQPEESAVPTEPDGKTYKIQRSAGAARSLVYRALKPGEIVLLELYSDKILFTALITRHKFEEVMDLNPPTYFSYEGSDYVRNDGLLFWGEVGRPGVSVRGW